MRLSTRAFWREGRREKGFSLFDFVHGYVYARWPYAYIGWAKGDRKLPWLVRPLARAASWWFARRSTRQDAAGRGRAFAARYHGKVLPPSAAEAWVSLETPIELRQLEHVIPFSIARDVVLSHPDHLVALECPCRAGMENPCLPLDVCLIVGEPFAQFILDHHPHRARRITSSEAVQILHEEHARGHVHHAFFKDAMLGRFYAICNCCSCCCGAMQAHRHGTPMLISSGFVAHGDASSCRRCNRCIAVCPFHALSLGEGAVQIDVDACMGCGVCVSACPHGALSLRRTPDRGEPLILSELLAAWEGPSSTGPEPRQEADSS